MKVNIQSYIPQGPLQEFPYIARTPNFIALPRETFLQFISA
jgi:hypothetical protein